MGLTSNEMEELHQRVDKALGGSTETPNSHKQQLRELIRGRPITEVPAKPEWGEGYPDREENSESTKTKSSWLKFDKDNVYLWTDDEFVNHLLMVSLEAWQQSMRESPYRLRLTE